MVKEHTIICECDLKGMIDRRVCSVCCRGYMQDAVIARTDTGSESFWKSDVWFVL